MTAWLLRLAGKLPPAVRQAILASPVGGWVHRAIGALVGRQSAIVPLSGPLAGHRMRLDLRYGRGMAYGDYEPSVVQAIQTWVQPGWTVLDVGSQVGYMTLVLAHQVGPTGHVFAFEPLPRNFAALRENMALNGYQTVTLAQLAVSNADGHVQLHQLDDRALSATASLLPRGRLSGLPPQAGKSAPPLTVDAIEVETIRLDTFMPAASRPIHFIKLDIEGAEAWALEGMTAILAQDRPLLLVEIHPLASGVNAAGALLQAHGYELWALETSMGSHLVGADYIGHVLARPKPANT